MTITITFAGFLAVVQVLLGALATFLASSMLFWDGDARGAFVVLIVASAFFGTAFQLLACT